LIKAKWPEICRKHCDLFTVSLLPYGGKQRFFILKIIFLIVVPRDTHPITWEMTAMN
jgi:hypothetical protein